jgi:lipoate-protein ligase A
MRALRILVSQSHNPWFNLATEEWIFRRMDPAMQTLFLWRNADCVVIGRNQNPWTECNLARMQDDGVLLARRTSGGGAVFHDLGNTNFTFLSPRAGYDRKVNLGIVLRALARFGITAEASGRNDIVVERVDGPRKVSGSAFRETKDRAFHHGTLLLTANLGRLQDYLTPHPKKLESKGRPSVRSRVMNLSELAPELAHAKACDALIEEFQCQYGERCETHLLDPGHLEGLDDLRETYEKLQSWDWCIGHTPQFRHQMSECFSWGIVEVYVDAENGRFERVQMISDSLEPDLIEDFGRALIGQAYAGSGVEAAAELTREAHPQGAAEIAELGHWLRAQIEID